MASYNGHKSWAYWNVSLWINNDEGLYNLARFYARKASNRHDAARGIQLELADRGLTQTPDGAKYSIGAIRAALVGM